MKFIMLCMMLLPMAFNATASIRFNVNYDWVIEKMTFEEIAGHSVLAPDRYVSNGRAIFTENTARTFELDPWLIVANITPENENNFSILVRVLKKEHRRAEPELLYEYQTSGPYFQPFDLQFTVGGYNFDSRIAVRQIR